MAGHTHVLGHPFIMAKCKSSRKPKELVELKKTMDRQTYRRLKSFGVFDLDLSADFATAQPSSSTKSVSVDEKELACEVLKKLYKLRDFATLS